MYKKKCKARLTLVTSLFVLLLSFLFLRLINIQIIQNLKLSKKGAYQHNVVIALEPKRGAIVDRNLKPLALNLRVDSVYAVAKDVRNKKEVADKLVEILGGKAETYFNRLNRDKLFVWLTRKVSSQTAKKIRALDIPGIELIDETKRFYPNGELASQVIGFAGVDNKGLEGIELLFDVYLKGTPGQKAIVRDAKRRQLPLLTRDHIPPIDGYNIELTIDSVIQQIAEDALDKAYKKYRAKSAAIIVMNPENGDILAMANRPTYNLNDFSSSDASSRKNVAVCSYFEPGSVFKIVTASACLQENAVSLEDNFFCENGAWFVRGHTLHDYHGYGNLTFRDVIVKSSNIGTVKSAMLLGEDKLYKHIKNFGFGKRTGIDLPGEISGVVRDIKSWSRYSITAIPMGQEVATTPIQLATGVCVIANGGLLVKPRIIKRIFDKKGEVIREYEPVIKGRVISKGTATKIAGIMEGVVERGTGKRAKVKEYRFAGKTGTAQKVEPTGRYSQSKFVATFAGFAPVEDPVIAICVVVDEPRPQHFGGTVSAPVFKEVANATLRYVGIKPGKEFSYKEGMSLAAKQDN